jgi:pimeloyl-ACP methyl ester carboxylesterase
MNIPSRHGYRLTYPLIAVVLAGCASPAAHVPPEALQFGPEAAPQAITCPAGPPADAKCWRGKDSAGAPYLIAMPARWSGTLFVHAHGGPFLGAPSDARGDEDMARWSIIVRQGHAYAASVFRQGGFAVTTAAQDTERVRRIFNDHVAKPHRTVLHGQSWGGMVATRAGEMYPRSWQGILLTSGVVAGPATYDFRIDIRALYQQLCNNHPRPSEAAYPLHMGLPAGSDMKPADLSARVNECLALNKPTEQRSAEQRAKAKLIADVIRIPESSIHSHMNWGTFTLADVTRRHAGAPMGNLGVRYSGSVNDAAFNAELDRAGLRFTADREARARFVADVDHQGRFAVPVISAHGIHDATVFVEGQDTLRQRMHDAGRGDRLVQAFVDSDQHSYWGDVMYPPLFNALLSWMDKGEKPTTQGIAVQCKANQQMLRASAADCKFLPDYAAKPMVSRIPAR